MSASDELQHWAERGQDRSHPAYPDRRRGYIGSSGHRSERSDPVRVSEVLDRFMGWLKKPPVDVLVVVFNNWEDVVGPDVARHCRPVAIDANQLVVVADDPMWADELRWNSEKVLDRLVEISGARRLERLTVRVGYHSRDDG